MDTYGFDSNWGPAPEPSPRTDGGDMDAATEHYKRAVVDRLVESLLAIQARDTEILQLKSDMRRLETNAAKWVDQMWKQIHDGQPPEELLRDTALPVIDCDSVPLKAWLKHIDIERSSEMYEKISSSDQHMCKLSHEDTIKPKLCSATMIHELETANMRLHEQVCELESSLLEEDAQKRFLQSQLEWSQLALARCDSSPGKCGSDARRNRWPAHLMREIGVGLRKLEALCPDDTEVSDKSSVCSDHLRQSADGLCGSSSLEDAVRDVQKRCASIWRTRAIQNAELTVEHGFLQIETQRKIPVALGIDGTPLCMYDDGSSTPVELVLLSHLLSSTASRLRRTNRVRSVSFADDCIAQTTDCYEAEHATPDDVTCILKPSGSGTHIPEVETLQHMAETHSVEMSSVSLFSRCPNPGHSAQPVDLPDNLVSPLSSSAVCGTVASEAELADIDGVFEFIVEIAPAMNAQQDATFPVMQETVPGCGAESKDHPVVLPESRPHGALTSFSISSPRISNNSSLSQSCSAFSPRLATIPEAPSLKRTRNRAARSETSQATRTRAVSSEQLGHRARIAKSAAASRPTRSSAPCVGIAMDPSSIISEVIIGAKNGRAIVTGSSGVYNVLK